LGILKAMGGSWPLPEHVAKVVERASEAKAAGRRCFVWRQIATSGLNEAGVADVIEQVTAMGWRLHSTALTFNTVAMNTEVGLFIFMAP
jgi:hypothetical protein